MEFQLFLGNTLGSLFITDGQLVRRVSTYPVRATLIYNYLSEDTIYTVSPTIDVVLFSTCVRFLWENQSEQQIWLGLSQSHEVNYQRSERAAQSGPANPTPRNTYSAPIWENLTPINTSNSRTHLTPVTPTLSGGRLTLEEIYGASAARNQEDELLSEPF